jgi:putative PIN family toxin of toxin-antitoxin system
MKVVIDTNVLVSGLLNPYNPPGAIVRLLAGGHFQAVYDARILSEYREVLLRPRFGFEPRHMEALLDYLKDSGLVVSGPPLKNRLPDPDDEPFLEAAMAESGTILVTGNKKHFPAEACGKVVVYSPAEFMEYLSRAQ